MFHRNSVFKKFCKETYRTTLRGLFLVVGLLAAIVTCMAILYIALSI